ncbi:Putative F-box protein At1g33530 [Linum grandiflorum]
MADSVVTRKPSEYACSWEKIAARDRMMQVYGKRVREWMKDSRGESDNVNEDEQQIRKKMKMTQAISIDHISLIADDEDLLVSLILSRLPVKSLMKFKCVSKGWKSIIEKDAHLINLHLTCSKPGFLIVAAPCVPPCCYDEDDNTRRGYDLSFFSTDLHLNVDSVKRIQSSVKCLGPVRGLLCLVDGLAVQIFNIGTGEVTPWLKPKCLNKYSSLDYVQSFSQLPRFFFGMDPSSGKHKVLCLAEDNDAEVLTVGEDSSWRIIDDDDDYDYDDDDDDVAGSFEPQLDTKIVAYANGSIYWFEKKRKSGVESLVAFDVGSEKFRMIPIPISTRLEAGEEEDTTNFSEKEKDMRQSYEAVNDCYCAKSYSFDGLIEMDGCLTLIRRRYQTVKMWRFHDYDKKENGSSSENEKDWSQVEDITLPDDITSDVFVYFHPILGKRQLMLETYVSSSEWDSHLDTDPDSYGSRKDQYFKRSVKFARFYLYDMRSKKFSRLRMDGVSSVPEDCRTTCAPLVESLLPVTNFLLVAQSSSFEQYLNSRSEKSFLYSFELSFDSSPSKFPLHGCWSLSTMEYAGGKLGVQGTGDDSSGSNGGTKGTKRARLDNHLKSNAAIAIRQALNVNPKYQIGICSEPSEYAVSPAVLEARKRKIEEHWELVCEWMRASCGESKLPIRKKMKKMQAISIDHISSSSTTSSCLIAHDEDLLISLILSRLPVKSLMKFKCVSKGWKSIIEKDAHLINLHLTRSEPGFLIIAAPPVDPAGNRDDENTRRAHDLSFLSTDLHLNVDSVKRIQSSVKCLGPVRGLLCLVDGFAVQIFNVGTGEVTPWFKPESLKHYTSFHQMEDHPRFFFGMDPTSGKHKVLCLLYGCKPEVLTVGEDNSWRRIDDVPGSVEPSPFTHISAYANGSVYWFENERSEVQESSGLVVSTYSEYLVAFDVGSEKFRRFQIPISTRLEAEEEDTTQFSSTERAVRRKSKFKFNGLIEMDGCLTLIRRRCQTVKMWKFHDHNKKDNGSTSAKEEDWSQVEEIKLPDDIRSDIFVYFYPICGKRQLMLETYVSSSVKALDLEIPVDSYDSRQRHHFRRNVKFARMSVAPTKLQGFLSLEDIWENEVLVWWFSIDAYLRRTWSLPIMGV